MILKSKESAWRNLINDLDQDVWGQAYKMTMGKLKPRNTIAKEVYTREMVRLFPARETQRWEMVDVEFTEEIDETEIDNSALSLKRGKAPGPDGIPIEVLQLLAYERPECFQSFIGKELECFQLAGRVPAWYL